MLPVSQPSTPPKEGCKKENTLEVVLRGQLTLDLDSSGDGDNIFLPPASRTPPARCSASQGRLPNAGDYLKVSHIKINAGGSLQKPKKLCSPAQPTRTYLNDISFGGPSHGKSASGLTGTSVFLSEVAAPAAGGDSAAVSSEANRTKYRVASKLGTTRSKPHSTVSAEMVILPSLKLKSMLTANVPNRLRRTLSPIALSGLR